MIAQWLNNPIVQILGWTLAHSLWQISAVAAAAWVAFWIMRRGPANARYVVGVAALLLMAAIPVATGVYLFRERAIAPSADLSMTVHPSTDTPLPVAEPAISAPTPLPHQRTATSVEEFLPYTVLAWFAGVLALSTRLALGCLRVRQLRRHTLPASADLQHILAQMATQLRVKRPIALLQSLLVEVPTVIGAFRPMILLPASALTGLSPEQLQGLLAHELAHIRRHDYLFNILQNLLETILFFHPAVWWISGSIRREREHCCDDAVIARGVEKRAYAEALAAMEGLRGGHGLTLAANSTALLPRIRRILGEEATTIQSRRLAGISSVFLAALLLAAFVYVVGCTYPQNTPANATPTEMSERLVPYNELTEYPDEWLGGPANRAARLRLDQNATLEADHEGLARVIEKLQAQSPTPVTVNWKSLHDAGIERDTPVTVNLQKMPYRRALTTILSETGAGTVQLGYVVQDGIITISTRDDLNSARYQVVRVFDVRDLLVQPDNVVTPPAFNLPDITKRGSEPMAKSRDDIVSDIIDTIKATVAPESWRNSGGTVGSIRELNGQLIVNQTTDNQLAIYQLLQQLRQGRTLQISIEARLMLVDPATYKKFQDKFGKEGAEFSSILPPKQLAEFMKIAEASANTVMVSEPRVTMFNGQNGYIASTIQQNYIADCKARTDETGKIVSPEYDVRTLTSGTILNLEATVSADHRYAVLKLRPSIRELQKMETFPAPGLPAGKDFIIQKPVLREVEMSSMVSVPDGETLMLSGVKTRSDLLTGVKGVEKKSDGVEGERYLIVLVRPAIIVQGQIEKRP